MYAIKHKREFAFRFPSNTPKQLEVRLQRWAAYEKARKPRNSNWTLEDCMKNYERVHIKITTI